MKRSIVSEELAAADAPFTSCPVTGNQDLERYSQQPRKRSNGVSESGPACLLVCFCGWSGSFRGLPQHVNAALNPASQRLVQQRECWARTASDAALVIDWHRNIVEKQAMTVAADLEVSALCCSCVVLLLLLSSLACVFACVVTASGLLLLLLLLLLVGFIFFFFKL